LNANKSQHYCTICRVVQESFRSFAHIYLEGSGQLDWIVRGTAAGAITRCFVYKYSQKFTLLETLIGTAINGTCRKYL